MSHAQVQLVLVLAIIDTLNPPNNFKSILSYESGRKELVVGTIRYEWHCCYCRTTWSLARSAQY